MGVRDGGHDLHGVTWAVARKPKIYQDDVIRAVGDGMPSDPDDPHSWRIQCDIRYRDPSPAFVPKVRVVWTCRRCRSDVRISEIIPPPGNAVGNADALAKLEAKALVKRARVHPRCSEAKAVREVMET